MAVSIKCQTQLIRTTYEVTFRESAYLTAKNFLEDFANIPADAKMTEIWTDDSGTTHLIFEKEAPAPDAGSQEG